MVILQLYFKTRGIFFRPFCLEDVRFSKLNNSDYIVIADKCLHWKYCTAHILSDL